MGEILRTWENEGYHEWLVPNEMIALFQPERDMPRSEVPICNPSIIRILSRMEGHIESVLQSSHKHDILKNCQLCALRRLNDRLGGLLTSQIGKLANTRIAIEAAHRAMVDMPLFTSIG